MAAVPLSRRRFLFAGSSTPDDEIRAIEEMLIAPCCWRQQLSIHESPHAESLRSEVRSLVHAGRSRHEILTVFVERYGNRILASPPAKGFFLWVYVLPPLSVAGGAIAFAFFLYRAASSRQQHLPADAHPSSVHDAQIEEELRTYAPID
jgi:cytochrome c-type biogenesis protein CcmH